MSYQDDLDWLARNVHEWDDKYDFVSRWHNGAVVWAAHPNGAAMYHKSEWLSRRAELQNKPSWKDAPEWAEWLAQDADGEWGWYEAKPIKQGSIFYSEDCGHARYGETLGDWRDTLERRPDMHKATLEIDTSADCWCGTCRPVTITDMRFVVCPECGNKRCPKANDHRSACTGSNELGRPDSAYPADTKGRDMDNSTSWHESGELPPVGVFVDVTGDVVYGEGEKGCEVIAHVEDCAVIRMSWGLGCFEAKVLSPTSTWRDEAIEAMKALCPYPGSWDTTYRLFAEALYDAGYRAGGSE